MEDAMPENAPPYDQQKQRLEELQAIVDVLREGQVDAVVGKGGIALLRLAEAERQLRHSQTRLHVALEASGGGVYERAIPPCDDDYHSERWAGMLGYRLEELPSHERLLGWVFDQIHLEDRPPIERAYRDFLAGTTDRYDVEMRIRHKHGHWVWTHDVARAIDRDTGGRVRHLAGMMSDITERKQAEAALTQLNATLEQQVAARTALAEQRAHDLRRLTAQLNHAEHHERKRLAKLLHDDLQQLLIAARLRLPVLVEVGPAEREQHLAKIDQLLVECLAASRSLTHELSPPVLQMGTLVEAIAWLAEWFGEKHGLAVTVEAQNELPEMPEHLRIFVFQAVRELLFNVIKHSGKLIARVGLTAREGWLTVQVDDCGQGFDPKPVAARLHQPEGFGLFQIWERVDALGGRLIIEATPQSGASFRFVVPLAEEATLRGGSEEAYPPEMAARRARRHGDGPVRLLIVEDHTVVREGLIGLLDSHREFQVIGEAADGEQAVQMADRLHPDAILMDVNMPKMDGIEATRRIKRAHADIVIIALSFHGDDAGRAMIEAGADTHVSKHASREEFLAAIRAACLT